MRKFTFYILLSLLSFSGFSQELSSKEERRMAPVLKRSTFSFREFKKDALITIEKTTYPEMEGQIENALFTAGFNVVSNKAAQEAITINKSYSSSNDTIEISKNIKFKSVYVITVNGTFYQGAVIGRCQDALLTFTARIVDLAADGKLVGTFKFSGNALTYIACVEDVANALVYSLSGKESKNN
jgi:hypothetical protein